MSTITLADMSSGPLTGEYRRELTLAAERAKTIRRAQRVAAFNGWATAILAVLSAPFALFSFSGSLVAVGLAAVAYVEFRGRRRLQQFDPSAATLLGFNQLALLALIVVYCLWMTYDGLSGATPFAAEIQAQPQLAQVLGSVGELDQMYKQLVVLFYGAVVAASLVFQGGTAWYYFSRRRHLQFYLQETPAWVLDLQRGTIPTP